MILAPPSSYRPSSRPSNSHMYPPGYEPPPPLRNPGATPGASSYGHALISVEGGLPTRRLVVSQLLLLTFLSGVTALICEVLWARRLEVILGYPGATPSLALATFGAAVAVGWGSLAAQRRARKPADPGPAAPLRAFAGLQAGVGVAVLASLPLLMLVREASLQLARAGVTGLTLSAASLGLAAFVLLPPSLLLGAAFASLAECLRLRLSTRRLAGLLGGVTALGGSLGSALAGWLLPVKPGISLALILTALLNLAMAEIARRLARSVKAETDRDWGSPRPSPTPGWGFRWPWGCPVGRPRLYWRVTREASDSASGPLTTPCTPCRRYFWRAWPWALWPGP